MWDSDVLQGTEAKGLINISLIEQDISSGPPPPPHFSVYESHSVSLALTGRAVLMANPQRWLGAVWGRSKALTSVTVFSTARYKSVMPKKAGT